MDKAADIRNDADFVLDEEGVQSVGEPVQHLNDRRAQVADDGVRPVSAFDEERIVNRSRRHRLHIRAH